MNIKKITIAGGGVLGSQIAFQSAYHNFDITIYDIDSKSLEKAKEKLFNLCKYYVNDMKATNEEVDNVVKSIKLSNDLTDATKEADLIIEAVPENMDIKKDFYTKLAKVASPKTIFTTNSSQLLPNDIKEYTGRPSKFLGLHFANEIWKFNTAEVMKTIDTDESVFNDIIEFAVQIGMVPIPIYKEKRGYILNSLLMPFLSASEYLYGSNIAEPNVIDKTWMKAQNTDKGPFATLDTVGLNTHMNIFKSNLKNPTDWQKNYLKKLEKMVEKGYTGKTEGRGFYSYPNPEFKKKEFFNCPDHIQKLEHDFKNITIAGGGVLGSQIAYQVAANGFNVSIYDINDDAINKAKERVDSVQADYAKDMNISKEDANKIKNSISYNTNLNESISNADLVIEVVPENIKIKKQFYTDLNSYLKQGTYVVTNTSTLRPSDFEDLLDNPEEFAALHFANHVWRNNTGEVMVAGKTSTATFNKILAFARDIDLIVLPIKREQPGYILNTLLVPFLTAGLELYADGIAHFEDIDKTWMIAVGSSLGPFAIIDVIGMNTVKNVIESKLNDPETVMNEKVLEIINKKIDNQELGISVGKGFYDYSDGIPYQKENFLEKNNKRKV